MNDVLILTLMNIRVFVLERHKLLQSTALPTEETSTEQNDQVPIPPPPPSRGLVGSSSSTPATLPSGYKDDPPLIISSPGPLEPSFEAGAMEHTSERISEHERGDDRDGEHEDEREHEREEVDDDEDRERPPPPPSNPFITSSEVTTFDENAPNRSVGAEEELSDYSTESSDEKLL